MDDFKVGFFQGYTDLKRRVALVYSEWDFSAFSGFNSDYWNTEVSTEIEEPLAKVGVGRKGRKGRCPHN